MIFSCYICEPFFYKINININFFRELWAIEIKEEISYY